MKCEICGHNNLIKQGDLFVCQNCGCKYTLEDARKLHNTDRNAEFIAIDNPFTNESATERHIIEKHTIDRSNNNQDTPQNINIENHTHNGGCGGCLIALLIVAAIALIAFASIAKSCDDFLSSIGDRFQTYTYLIKQRALTIKNININLSLKNFNNIFKLKI